MLKGKREAIDFLDGVEISWDGINEMKMSNCLWVSLFCRCEIL
jgi:hypothetical protein